MSRPIVRVILALVCLGVAASSLAACGGGNGSDGDSVDQVLAQTFGDNSKAVKSGKLDVGVQIDAQGLQRLNGPLSIKLSGPFETKDPKQLPRFDFTAAINASGQSINAGAISTGDNGYLQLQGRTYEIGRQLFDQFKQGYARAQAKQPDRKTGTTFKALGIDPRGWLTDARKAGTEKVGGADTTHITGGIDVPVLLADLNKLVGQAGKLGVSGAGRTPQQLSAADRKQIAQSIKSAKVDLWTGQDDRLLRKLTLAVSFDVPQAARQSARGLQSGRIVFDLLLADLNEDQTITAPKNARPLSELTGSLGGLGAGAASGSGGASPGAGGASAAPGAAGSSEYLQCLQQAGQDIAAIQQCSAKLQAR